MHQIRQYFYSLWQSISDPEFYFSILRRATTFSLVSYTLTLLLLSTVIAGWWRVSVLPQFLSDAEVAAESVLLQLPETATVSYRDYRVEFSGMTLPFIFRSPALLTEYGFPQHLAALTDTETAQDALLTLTPTQLLTTTANNSEALSYREFAGDTTFSLDREGLRRVVRDQVAVLREHLTSIALVLVLLHWTNLFFSGFILIAFLSIVTQSLAWFVGIRLRYAHAYRWGLHIYPIAVAVEFLATLFVSENPVPLTLMTYLCITLMILWTGKRTRSMITIDTND